MAERFGHGDLWSFDVLKSYMSMTKPGIIVGNLITVIGGFGLASQGYYDYKLLGFTLFGVTLVIASGCVLNNTIDQDIDRLMSRTRNRVMAQSLLPSNIAVTYGVLLGISGLWLLATQVNVLSAVICAFGLFSYVVIYTLWLKRASTHSTEVGSIAGATPIVVGYTAVTNYLDSVAFIIFIQLCLWQIPHSYAITVFRFSDYRSASIPVLPVVKGVRATKASIYLYSLLFLPCLSLLTLFGATGYAWLVVMLPGAAFWVWQARQGFSTEDNEVWARKVFLFSVVLITVFSSMLVANDYIEKLFS